MRRLWLHMALLCAVATAAWAAPPGSAAFSQLLEQAEAERNRDMLMFHSTVRQLNSLSAVATPAERERLDMVNAHAALTSGEVESAIRIADALAARTSDAAMELRAKGFLVNAYAISRNYGAGLALLDELLAEEPALPDASRGLVLDVAAIFYNQIGRHALGAAMVERALKVDPDPNYFCLRESLSLESAVALAPKDIAEQRFINATNRCSGQSYVLNLGFIVIQHARWLMAMERQPEAIATLTSRLKDFQETRYPRLIAEAHGLLAELHLAGGDLSAADRHASVALDNSRDLPTGLPLLMARRTLYEVAKRRGATEMALRNLEGYLEADRAYLNELNAMEVAFQLSQHEARQREQALALLGERNKVLTLQNEVAKQSALNSRIGLGAVLILLAGLGAWSWRVKVAQRRYRTLAQTDALTGLHNRLYFQQRGDELVALAKRNGEPVSLLLFDMDHFKQINDRHGHARGDWTLTAVAQMARAHCRSNDVLARVGGEEFALLLPNCALRDALQRAERLRAAIAGIDSAASGREFPISASVGVASTEAGPYVLDTLLSQADHQLYAAKHAGRNRVVADAPHEPPPAA